MRSPRLAIAVAALAGAAIVRPVLQAQEPPRLVLFISIDQMRSDYIDRYGPRWTSGLRRLTSDGARFVQAAYPYFNTVTCAGHATMSTGTFPSTHGMVLNAWWDRGLAKDVACTDDETVQAISYHKPATKSGGNSAALLRTHTFADELRGQATRPPHIVTVSMKPRSAIMLAGHRGDAVVWFESGGGFTTSTAFTDKPTPFVEAFVKANPLDVDGEWTRLLPESDYLDTDDGEGEQAPAGWTKTFPHPLRSKTADGREMSNWAWTPRADAYLARFALAAVDALQMGQNPGTDFLGISFSVLDSVGHNFGPRSHEVQDVLFRLDRTIGELLDSLDKKVGAGRYVVALTGDHGVAPVPEQAARLGLDAGRVDLRLVASKVEALLSSKFGPGKYVARGVSAYTDLYFAPGVFDKLRADEKVMRDVLDAIGSVPGIARVLRSDHLMDPEASDDPVVRAARLSQFPGRSGDLILVPKAYWLMSTGTTTHGTYYGYDQHVPVVLYGAGVRPGRYWQAASPADIAPTLAALCGITMARVDGRVLSEALSIATPAAPPSPRPSATR